MSAGSAQNVTASFLPSVFRFFHRPGHRVSVLGGCGQVVSVFGFSTGLATWCVCVCVCWAAGRGVWGGEGGEAAGIISPYILTG